MYVGFTQTAAKLMSFEAMLGSPTWQETWVGNRQQLDFVGSGRVPTQFPGTNCTRSPPPVELVDLLGNEV